MIEQEKEQYKKLENKEYQEPKIGEYPKEQENIISYNFSLIMALLFSQHKMIEWLEQQISKPKINLRSRLREIFRA